MRFESIEITNFRNLRSLRLDGLPLLIVLAGPNGSGKTSLFDALRVFKEAFGSYSQRSSASQVRNLLGQISPVIAIGETSASISATVVVTEAEAEAIELPMSHLRRLEGLVSLTSQRDNRIPSVQASGPDIHFLNQLFGERYQSGGPIGVMSHIGPERRFSSSRVASISFSKDYEETELSRLNINTADKFTNLAEMLVRMHFYDLQEWQNESPHPHNYIDGVREIFRHFLPDKDFVGVRIPENLSGAEILVRSGGIEHDIEELSSGQREILMTYTHLEKLRPTGSIILFDEPELHLHPGLQRKVVAHLLRLIERGSNQIWVITHSEEIVGTVDHESLFALTGIGDPAATPVANESDRIRLLQDLGASVGIQLSSQRLLFVEGESDAELLKLFAPELPPSVSIVETGGKGTLMRLTPAAMRVLEDAVAKGEFFFVRDQDVEDFPEVLRELSARYSGRFFAWDRYHIENYLLDSTAIFQVMSDDPDIETIISADNIDAELRKIADTQLDRVIANHLEGELNRVLRSRLVLNPSEGVKHSLDKATSAKLTKVSTLLAPTNVDKTFEAVSEAVSVRWETEWRSLCIGRDVLRRFHKDHLATYLGFGVFRNRVARKIVELDRVPAAIDEVICAVSS